MIDNSIGSSVGDVMGFKLTGQLVHTASIGDVLEFRLSLWLVPIDSDGSSIDDLMGFKLTIYLILTQRGMAEKLWGSQVFISVQQNVYGNNDLSMFH